MSSQLVRLGFPAISTAYLKLAFDIANKFNGDTYTPSNIANYILDTPFCDIKLYTNGVESSPDFICTKQNENFNENVGFIFADKSAVNVSKNVEMLDKLANGSVLYFNDKPLNSIMLVHKKNDNFDLVGVLEYSKFKDEFTIDAIKNNITALCISMFPSDKYDIEIANTAIKYMNIKKVPDELSYFFRLALENFYNTMIESFCNKLSNSTV
jgi:hypothetical protein